MFKLIYFTLFLITNIFSCKKISLDGTWVSKEDKMSKIIFRDNNYYNVYDSDTISKGTFERRIYTCDTNYIDAYVKADFILLKGEYETCYEITGISDSTLAYRHTKSGKLHVFSKV